MGMKKTYGILNKSTQNVEKIAENKVERVLVDTLYIYVLIGLFKMIQS